MIRSAIYGLGAGAGFDPRTVDTMTVWELAACIDGINAANSSDSSTEAPSDAEFDAMLKLHGVATRH